MKGKTQVRIFMRADDAKIIVAELGLAEASPEFRVHCAAKRARLAICAAINNAEYLDERTTAGSASRSTP